jgi:hypothetical protein
MSDRGCLVCRDECAEDFAEPPLRGVCVHCGGPACDTHDRCYGCGALICQRCDTEPTPAFTYGGAKCVPHPHNEAGT